MTSKKTTINLMVLLLLVVAFLTGYGFSSNKALAETVTDSVVEETGIPASNKDADAEVNSEQNEVAATLSEDTEPREGMFDPWFKAFTSVAYSSGDDSEWAYGNQRKEFTSSKPCYVRISNSVIAPWHWGYVFGLGNQITITYRFTGVSNCKVNVSDGFLTEIKSEDPNVIMYTRTIKATAVEENDNIVIFQYTPLAPGSVTIEVLYDNQVRSQYDVRNTVYFVENDTW